MEEEDEEEDEGGTQTNTAALIIPFYKYSQSNNCPFQQGFH